jgi:hypothetical protein
MLTLLCALSAISLLIKRRFPHWHITLKNQSILLVTIAVLVAVGIRVGIVINTLGVPQYTGMAVYIGEGARNLAEGRGYVVDSVYVSQINQIQIAKNMLVDIQDVSPPSVEVYLLANTASCHHLHWLPCYILSWQGAIQPQGGNCGSVAIRCVFTYRLYIGNSSPRFFAAFPDVARLVPICYGNSQARRVALRPIWSDYWNLVLFSAYVGGSACGFRAWAIRVHYSQTELVEEHFRSDWSHVNHPGCRDIDRFAMGGPELQRHG